ncbi:AEC family transporter [Clavibacter michiganensis]|uniref:Transporter n=1 Tax=Clavibacter michiganensis subsp. insidiosus TaxID=33014 RepID=A0A0D5CIW7_9MICO|nr:AEC family transporter [Clavibacter michiganensis]AJW79613.1 transporter [Clavibacter michiganensis subsp. insidiosus]AWF97615.1 transporter [Clavibacter michiganensis subsp. insidiosus]
MVLTIATALLPVFFVMALGFFAGKRRIVDNSDVGSLNHLVMLFALPISLFTAIAVTDRSVILANWWLAVVLVIVMVLTYAIVYVAQTRIAKLSPGDAAVQTLTTAFPNYAAIGLPLTAAVFGPSAALAVAVAIAAGSVTISPLTLALLENARATEAGETGSTGRRFLTALGRSVRKPIFLGPVLGLVWSLLAIPVPDLLSTTLREIGGVAAGVALFLTGLILSAQRIRITGNAVVSSLVKTVAQPILGLLVIVVLRVPQPFAGQALLLLSIPAGFFGILFGLNHKLRPAVAGSTLVLSSLMSIVTLSIAIALLSGTG